MAPHYNSTKEGESGKRWSIGIIDTMSSFEDPCLVNSLELVSKKRIGSRNFYSCVVPHADVIIAPSGWGKISSAVTAALLMSHYHLDIVLLIGYCGALHNSPLLVGDIVIGREYVHRDFDARPIYDQYEIPLLGISFFSTDTTTIQVAQASVNQFITQHSSCVQKHIPKRVGQKIQYREGLIATQDQFLGSLEKSECIVQELPQVAAVDMEGASVAQVAYEYGIPFSAIKVVSDMTNHEAALQFHEFMRSGAKKYAELLPKAFIDNFLHLQLAKSSES